MVHRRYLGILKAGTFGVMMVATSCMVGDTGNVEDRALTSTTTSWVRAHATTTPPYSGVVDYQAENFLFADVWVSETLLGNFYVTTNVVSTVYDIEWAWLAVTLYSGDVVVGTSSSQAGPLHVNQATPVEFYFRDDYSSWDGYRFEVDSYKRKLPSPP